jgi:thiamine-monophosphate kinase
LPLEEKALIARLRRQAAGSSPAVVEGIGDDCAVLRPRRGCELLVTTDCTLENVHFRRAWSSPEEIGHRSLVRGLSDIAAMGGEARAAFLSLALPARLQQRWVDGFLRGLLKLAREHGVVLAGGDIAQSPGGVLADIVVVGEAPAGKAVRRSGARPGDRVYVTGELGLGAAAVVARHAGRNVPTPVPQPRLRAGRALRNIASAMIDVSDGLSTDLAHICEESGVGAVIAAGRVPAPAGIDFALHGGDDYELLFTARGKVPARVAGVRVSEIGRVVRARGLWVEARGRKLPLHPGGWEHFAR